MLLEELKALYSYSEPQTNTRFHKKSYVDGQIDYFVGISLPELRTLAKKYYKTIQSNEIKDLLTNKIHEHRLLALLILSYQMKKANIDTQKQIIEFYLENIDFIDNWDLVDLSAPNVLGKYLYNIKDFSLLYELSLSNDLWYKRISIVSTWHLISKEELSVTLDLVDNLINESHDLLHKACGWMLRELGKKDINLLTDYIETNYIKMPRTMLRYAIEKYPEDIRKRILKGDFLWR
ncbi:MAG: DNA alkylation repair protein [Candidatus Izemoplasmatales bacterium]|nr:DNA alkylation repair protein [Candidatus Izemoplasmatales bacterium]